MLAIGHRPHRCAVALAAALLALLGVGAGAAEGRPDSELWALLDAREYQALRERGPAVLDELADLYRATPEPDERLKIANAFYVLGWKSEAAREAMLADAGTRHRDLRVQVQWALGRVSDDDRVVDYLFETLIRGDDLLFRDKAACALASDQIHLSDAQRVRLLSRVIDLLESPEPWLRWTAMRVLETQTGQRKGFLPKAPPAERAAAVARWRAWLDEYRSQL